MTNMSNSGPDKVFGRAIDGRTRVEHRAALWQQQARRLPSIVRMIAGRTEQDQFHARECGGSENTGIIYEKTLSRARHSSRVENFVQLLVA